MKAATVTRHDGGRDGRFYEVDGVLLPSVTNILGAIHKPALIPWAANQERTAVSEAAADLYAQWAAQPHATQLPRAAYLSTLLASLGTVRAHQKTLEAAGNIGTETHKLIEWTMRVAVGAEAGPRPVVSAPALWAFRAFEAWAASVRLKPVLIERTVYSKRYGYAGTMDVLARVDGVLTLIDFKTGKGIYPEAYLQSAAYSVALEEMGYQRPGNALIVRLPKLETDPGFEVAVVPPAAELFPVFLATKDVWTWSVGNERAYRARPKPAKVAPTPAVAALVQHPVGYLEWFDGLYPVAMAGTAALEQAWHAAPSGYKFHLRAHTLAKWEMLKAIAARMVTAPRRSA